MTQEQRQSLSPDDIQYKLIVGGSKNQICGWMMIWQSRLATKKKWVLSIMFSGGLLVTAAGILRCVLILT
ncbi:MAG: hypothetical protein Q9221_001492, partial [Calogaya cf. arnoldii]